MAHVQREIRGVPSVPEGVVGLQADVPRAREGGTGVSQPQGKKPGQQRQSPRERHRRREAWSTLDTCFDRPEKYIAEALEPVIKFRSYKAFDNGAIREFYSLLRAAMMGARKAGLLQRLVNDQMLPSILAKMPPSDWRQWARERPTWMREAIEEAFWSFVDQKWRDALNVAAAELPTWGMGSGKGGPYEGERRGMAEAKKLAQASVHVTGLEGKRHRQGDSGRRCIFADVMRCLGMHPPLALQGIREDTGQGEGKNNRGQPTLPILLASRQGQAMWGKGEVGQPGMSHPKLQGKAHSEVA